MDDLPPLFDHQQTFVNLWLNNPKVANFGDAGTGKTRSCLETIVQRNTGKRTLVLATLSILESAWGEDIVKWTPSLTYSIAYAKNRAQAFKENTDMVITNHDAVKWIMKNPDVLKNFDTLIIDESTAFKNRSSARTKAMFELSEIFEYIAILTGTPTSNGVCDLWAQMYILDEGERLGQNFFGYRHQVCHPKQVGPNPNMVQWLDKPDAEEKILSATHDIVFRVKLEECIDMPENSVVPISVTLPKALMKKYYQMLNTSILELESEELVNAVHAGAKVKKLLQICTGALYTEEGLSEYIHSERYRLVTDLILEREQCVVAFNWRHERDHLVAHAEKEGFTYAVIDGSTPAEKRPLIAKAFQSGEIKVIYAHPQSAGHGLTLTKGTSTIWSSPTYNAEHFQQFNRRIYRAGQKRKTETLLICAKDTWEEDVYQKLEGKVERMDSLLDLFGKLKRKAA